jgi:DNA gyrase subunit A
MSTETENESVVLRPIVEEMRAAYIDYSMSVIVSRALPDVRDGLKPVHRRVLYGMSELGLLSSREYKKSARIVGEVLGKYHPHGDSAVYDTMVRMAQPWSLRYPMVDGQGNFGSMDGDNPAAMRYTEARLHRIAEEMLADINKNTVDFQPNFDDSLTEPSVLPARIPNLLVNGASGIAVGMATNMAPHNLREVAAGIIAYIDNRQITSEELMEHIKAPDFPTGGIIYGYEGVRDAFLKGRGRIIIRAQTRIETTKSGKTQIIVSEMPYMVNKALLHEKIVQLVNDRKIEGISDVRDESDRDGVRLVIDLKKDAVASVVVNNLFKHTALQSTFNVNNIALVKGRPQRLTLRDLIRHFVDHRHDVVILRTTYELEQALHRAHILEGLIIALDNLDEVIQLIRSSKDVATAKSGLMVRFGLSEIQATAILDMRLQRLTNLEQDKIVKEYQETLKKIEYYRQVLAQEDLRMGIIKEELNEVVALYGDERRTAIVFSTEEFRMEDMIANEEVVITLTHAGYIKRTALSEYRRQGRGGIGTRAAATREEDFVEHLFIAETHNYLLFFTELGRCYWLKCFEIPEGGRSTKGRAIQNLIQIQPDDKVLAVIKVNSLEDPEVLSRYSIAKCTVKGVIKKTSLEAYSRPRANGINAIHINEGDRLLNAALVDDKSQIVLATRSGYANRFNASDIRDMGRLAAGVRGIRIDSERDEVIGMVVVSDPDAQLLVVSEQGFGKRSSLKSYPVNNRGGKGVKTLQITDRTGDLISIQNVVDDDDLMIITQDGTAIRMAVREIRETGRATQGVRLIRLRPDDRIAAVAKIAESHEESDAE